MFTLNEQQTTCQLVILIYSCTVRTMRSCA